ncbi:hypothetical protein RB25_24760 [Herbaspirillum rubrisubalbicans]|uniref:DUF4150 domain-containing protein n=1 Tax=Herbaspirillum rubrisubalbicans TaxID=80842 RepID=UPI000DC3FA57|nr:DUF4150 domain-containing protein [Herbaspirillum rubrisubalbicans]RAN42965.1 hypothetical protein RB25_24760 [Herbaspirillum rubrisubalbicans]
MAITINVNGLSLCHRGSGGVSHNTLPNVCKTPDKGIPLPYQNEAYSRDLIKGTVSVFADGGNSIAKEGSQFAKSVFDEAGSMGGVVSGTHSAETDWISHSFDVFFEGKPACRLTDKLFMNHRNTVNMAGLKQRDLPKPDQDFFDEICELACECWNTHKKDGPQPLPKGHTFQECMRKKIDDKYYDGPANARNGRYPKLDARMWREVSFDRGNNWEMIGSKSNPGLPSSQYPWNNSRRLDIARIGADGKLSKIYDVKFGDDTLAGDAANDYRKIAERNTGSDKNFEKFEVNKRCNCDDEPPPQHPAPVTAAEPKKSLIDEFGDAIHSTTGVQLTGGLLVFALIISEASRLFPPRNAIPIP